jgi:hypothetical protein
MRKLLLVVCLLTMPAGLLAQSAAHQVPKYLQIIREEVKVGKGAAHEKWEASWMQAMVRTKFTTPQLAMTSATGANEALFISGYDSLGAMEADMKMINESPAMQAVMNQYGTGDAEYVSNGRTQLAVFRDDLSYNTNVRVGEMRYFQIRTVRIRPGHDDEYAALRKLINDARKQSNSPVHSAVFQVISGAPNGTYLVINPLKSLADADPAGNISGLSMGNDGAAKLSDLINRSIMSSEDEIYAFSPRMSNPSPDMLAQDPGFWKPKPAAATTASKTPAPGAKKKEEKK